MVKHSTLPIEKFFGVGKVTAAKLRELGSQTGADLKHMGEERYVSLGSLCLVWSPRMK